MKRSQELHILLVALGISFLVIGDVQSAVPFNIQVCSAKGKCITEADGQVISGSYTGCGVAPYNQKNCPSWSIASPSQYPNWGLKFTPSNPSSMTIAMNAPWNSNSGVSALLTAGPTATKYRMFQMLGQEISFEVDLSTVGCGLNAAIFFVSAPADGGKQAYGFSGANYGTGYCDGQPAKLSYPGEKPSCDEFDIMEANSFGASFGSIPYSCTAAQGATQQPIGCGMKPYPMGFRNFYGRGPNFQVDTTKPFTVVTRFYNTSSNGNLHSIQRFYIQKGKTIPFPTVKLGNTSFSSLTDDYCTKNSTSPWNIMQTPNRDVISGISGSLRNGMVLVSCIWGDANDDSMMAWLDGSKWGQGPCPLNFTNSNPYVTFSNIKVGPIGSTN